VDASVWLNDEHLSMTQIYEFSIREQHQKTYEKGGRSLWKLCRKSALCFNSFDFFRVFEIFERTKILGISEFLCYQLPPSLALASKDWSYGNIR